uniref:Ig-like domain-containing protein n=1 Tax=Astyanax mexicanus TaxID=7994 RepID=A0A3B1KBH2_ASTMX
MVQMLHSGSTVVAPGQSTTLTCRVSGYSLSDSSYCTDWIRQPAGKALEWVGEICGSGSTYYSDKLKSRFEVTRDSSSSTLYLQMTNLKSEDTAVYYCARQDSQWLKTMNTRSLVTVLRAAAGAAVSPAPHHSQCSLTVRAHTHRSTNTL